jgi:tRNA 2-selenouridine synthase
VSVHLIPAEEALLRLADRTLTCGGFSAVIDARSEDEFAHDHLPGAVNWPTLNNAERVQIGTMYKQINPFEAQKLGAALAAANISRHIAQHALGLPRQWQPLIYCWRGGKRSGSLSLVLGQIGFKVNLIEGGYKAFRHALLADLPRRVERLSFRVVCGPTGSGKTRLLETLAREGAQVLDLEALASHRSSVLGVLPGRPQPSQKHFDTRVWTALCQFDPARPVFVEAESRKVGNLSVPESLMLAMRASPCVHLQLSDAERVGLLMEDYDFFVRDPEFFCLRLSALVELRGHATVEDWQQRVRRGDVASVVEDLLHTHYDPTYASSLERNFKHSAGAPVIELRDRSTASMREAALALMKA